ncbi:MAG: peptidyl-tRNA hydrolase, family [Thermotogaceae bacterium]|nr:peptidyl-tRNA hydrolase, family [Thermotogaceae bacterium]
MLVGLGNPGPRYAFTRHNVGFMVIDEILKGHRSDYIQRNKSYDLGKITIDEESLFFLKPLTFMNLSGTVLPEVLNILKINYTEILVIYDDIALPLGKIRIRKNGSSGGHNGIKSVIQYLGTQDFARLRIGIGPKPEGITLTDFVLGEFTEEEFDILKKVLKISVEAIECILHNGFEEAMRVYNSFELF